MKWLLIIVGALIAWLLYRDSSSSDSDSSDPAISIPLPIVPVVTGGNSNSQQCVGKTDAQGNWYGVNLSGNCTIEGLGGAGGDF
jgi:hypothetical protein